MTYQEQKIKCYTMINENATMLHTTNQQYVESLYAALLSIKEQCSDNENYLTFLKIITEMKEELST